MERVSRKSVSKHAQVSDEFKPQNSRESTNQPREQRTEARRIATVYDAVAGRIGLRSFLKPEQLESNQVRPSAPEEVLLRRVDAPDQISYSYYNADERLDTSQKLPDSDLLKDIHAYVADYYEVNDVDKHGIDFKSFDETALLSIGILLEEACKEALGENGDMVFTEPASFDQQMPRSLMSQHQIIGKVVPQKVQEYESSTDDESDRIESRPRKRARRRYGNTDDI